MLFKSMNQKEKKHLIRRWLRLHHSNSAMKKFEKKNERNILRIRENEKEMEMLKNRLGMTKEQILKEEWSILK